MAGENNLSFELEVRGVAGVVHGLTEVNKAIKEITKSYIQANQSGDLQGMVRATNELKKALDIKTNIQAFSRGMLDVSGNIGATAQSSRNAAMAMLNLNYVIRDSPYFFNNFAMGVLAVGNNLNPLIDSMIRTKQEAQAMGVTFGSLMRQTFLGTSGVIFALSMAVAAFQAITFWLAKTDREAKNVEKSLDLIGDAVNRLLKLQNPFEKLFFSVKPEELDKLISATDELIKQAEKTGEVLSIGITTGQGETRVKLNLEGIVKENEKNLEISGKVLEKLKEQNAEYKAQKQVYELLKSLGIDIVDKEKEKIKELKNQKDLLKGLRDLQERGYRFASDKEEELFRKRMDFAERLAEHYRRLGLSPETADELAFYVASNLQSPREGLPVGMQKVPEKNPALEQIDKDLEEISKNRLRVVSQVANVAGNAISNAFLSGKNAIDAAVQALKEFIVQLMVVQTLKGVLNVIGGGTFLEGFLSFANGGIVPKADNGMIVPGSSYSGDKVLVRVNSGEMILNKQQQRNLFDMISGAKFGGGGMQKLKIDIGGKIEAKQDKFVIDFKKAERRVNKYLTT